MGDLLLCTAQRGPRAPGLPGGGGGAGGAQGLGDGREGRQGDAGMQRGWGQEKTGGGQAAGPRAGER